MWMDVPTKPEFGIQIETRTCTDNTGAKRTNVCILECKHSAQSKLKYDCLSIGVLLGEIDGLVDD